MIEDHDRIAVKILCLKVNIPLQRITLVLLRYAKDQELIIKVKCLRSLWFSDFRFMVLSVALAERKFRKANRDQKQREMFSQTNLLFSNS